MSEVGMARPTDTDAHTHTHTHKHKQLPNNNEMSTFLVAFAKLAKSDY